MLHDNVRIAWDVLAQHFADGAAVEVVAAAWAGAHQDHEVLALVEIGDALLRRSRACEDKRACDNSGGGYESENPRIEQHGFFSEDLRCLGWGLARRLP
jgi:hypothetical protein